MQRRKKARQELWLSIHSQQVQDKPMQRAYEKAARASVMVGLDACERESRRWG
ncbi:hypothetical protein D3C86_2248750 [compost metagenome]